MNSYHNQFMKLALDCAEQAASSGGTPVGAVIIDSNTNTILAQTYNQVENLLNPTAHAEILAIEKACQIIGNHRLTQCDLYVTLEPCTMCAAAIAQARIRRLYFGAYDLKAGAVDNGVRFFYHKSCNHTPEVYGGIMEKEANILLTEFFKNKRA